MSERDGAIAVRHLFTVDVEEYFQVHAFEDFIQRGEWGALPSRVHVATDRLLGVLEDHGVTATFFVLGWVADRNPGLVRRVSDAGHEIASHGWWHRRVTELTPEEFREDVRETRDVLEQLTGRGVKGFRAPSFSVVRGKEWVFEVLLEEGYRYDSSVFPVRRIGHGYPGACPVPHLVDTPSGTLLELPLTTLRWGGFRVPAAGGAYLRHLPLSLVREALRRAESSRIPGVFYIHPWEFDPDQPRFSAPWLARLRHYGGLDRTRPRVEELLDEFGFTSVADRFGLEADPPPAVELERYHVSASGLATV